MNRKVKVALCGSFAHIEKFGRLINGYEESEVVAVWSDEPEIVSGMAERLGCRFYEEYDEVLAIPDLDGVVISTPNDLKEELLIKAAEAGKSIFVEKPMCIPDRAVALRISQTVKENNVKFYMTDPMVGRSTLFVKDFMESGKLGQIQSIIVRYGINSYLYDDSRYGGMKVMARRMKGGVMADIGTHALHQMYFLAGRPADVRALFGYTSDEARQEQHEDFASVQMRFHDGCTGYVESGVFLPDYADCVEVCGTHGVIIDETFGNNKTPTIRYCLTQFDEEEKKDLTALTARMKMHNWVSVSENELMPEPDDHVRYWIRMLAYDIPNEQVGVDPESHHGMGLDGATDVIRILEAIYKSAKSGNVEEVI